MRKSEYARLSGRQRRYIKGQKYTLLSRRENLSLDGRQALSVLLKANKRLNVAYVLKESSDSSGITSARPGRGGSSTTGAPAQVAALEELPEVRRHDRSPLGRHRCHCRSENKVSLGFVEGLNGKSASCNAVPTACATRSTCGSRSSRRCCRSCERLRPCSPIVAPCSRRSRTSPFGVALRAILDRRRARRTTRCHGNDAAERSQALLRDADGPKITHTIPRRGSLELPTRQPGRSQSSKKWIGSVHQSRPRLRSSAACVTSFLTSLVTGCAVA